MKIAFKMPLLFAVLFLHSATNVFSSEKQLDSVVTYSVGNSEQDWLTVSSSVYSYDDYGRCKSLLMKKYLLRTVYKIDYSYGSNDSVSVIESSYKNESDAEFTIASRKYRVYSADGFLLKDSVFQKNDTGNLGISTRSFYSYSEGGRVNRVLTESFNDRDSSWYLPSVDTIVYNADKKIARRSQKYKYKNSSQYWTEVNRVDYYYAQSGGLDSIVEYSYDMDSYSLLQSGKVEYSGTQLDEIHYVQDTSNGAWFSDEYIKYVVDGSESRQDYGLPPYFDFPTDRLPSTKVYLKSDLVGGTWVESSRDVYYWSGYEPLERDELAHQELMVFPNPVGNVLNVVVPVAVCSKMVIKDVLGNTVLLDNDTTNGRSNCQIDVSGLLPGYYTIYFIARHSVFSAPFVKD